MPRHINTVKRSKSHDAPRPNKNIHYGNSSGEKTLARRKSCALRDMEKSFDFDNEVYAWSAARRDFVVWHEWGPADFSA